ncbi:MAG: LysR family transcriptional regulator [Rhizobiales bacterium 24-66-13]|jgi:DNA-binding transcriptional LysR family regulator|nr:MAG: LysR family transcriptional regulator [Rhizobiales bacterium 12-68-15]OYZ73905.1 MAG: LysR family transcriptional regulator [Rhizobiales bacterium 24-66-13]OZB11288.1 MAG: LysR family transcriptional regulator [Rhizobiales bacterium 39-66-18]
MARENINDLLAFIAVARERSFTRAASRMGVSQSALSHTIRQLEARLGVRLLTRTTRAVSPTEAGERLLQGIGPHFDEIEAQVDALNDLRDTPAGTIRISASDYAISSILWPKLQKFLPRYPDIKVELMLDNGLTDIVTERYDAGVRMGEQLAKDMISARIGPDFRFAVVGTPAYFAEHPVPEHPQELVQHRCINYRFQTSGGLWAWDFEKDGRELKIRVDGQLAFNNIFHVLDAALAGAGLAFVPEEIARDHTRAGQLIRVLEDWCAYWDGFYLYYPSRRQSSPAFVALLDALRHRT